MLEACATFLVDGTVFVIPISGASTLDAKLVLHCYIVGCDHMGVSENDRAPTVDPA